MLRASLKFSFIVSSCVLSQPVLAQAQLSSEIDLTRPQD